MYGKYNYSSFRGESYLEILYRNTLSCIANRYVDNVRVDKKQITVPGKTNQLLSQVFNYTQCRHVFSQHMNACPVDNTLKWERGDDYLPGLHGSDWVVSGGQILPAGQTPQSSLDDAPSISIT